MSASKLSRTAGQARASGFFNEGTDWDIWALALASGPPNCTEYLGAQSCRTCSTHPSRLHLAPLPPPEARLLSALNSKGRQGHCRPRPWVWFQDLSSVCVPTDAFVLSTVGTLEGQLLIHKTPSPLTSVSKIRWSKGDPNQPTNTKH